MDDLKNKAEQEFESSLPMNKDNFKKLFVYLDAQLIDISCDDTNILTKTFLLQSNIEKVDKVFGMVSRARWLLRLRNFGKC